MATNITDVTEYYENTSLENDIVIITREQDRKVVVEPKQNGLFDVVCLENIGISSSSVTGHNLARISVSLPIKISVPVGLLIFFTSPRSRHDFYDKIYVDRKEYEYLLTGEETETPRLVSTIITELSTTIYVDLKRMKDINRAAGIQKGNTLLSFYFSYIFIPDKDHPTSTKRTIIVKNNDVYDNLTKPETFEEVEE